MRDLNIDLMKIDAHTDSDFLNSLESQIFQSSKIASHSATLIDNIFFNSSEHLLIFGNLVYDLTKHRPSFVILNEFYNHPSI